MVALWPQADFKVGVRCALTFAPILVVSSLSLFERSMAVLRVLSPWMQLINLSEPYQLLSRCMLSLSLRLGQHLPPFKNLTELLIALVTRSVNCNNFRRLSSLLWCLLLATCSSHSFRLWSGLELTSLRLLSTWCCSLEWSSRSCSSNRKCSPRCALQHRPFYP